MTLPADSPRSHEPGCHRDPHHNGVCASMIGYDELFDLYGITENQVQEWANEAEKGYDTTNLKPYPGRVRQQP